MKLACQEHQIPGNTLAEKMHNLEEYGYDGIEFSGLHLKNRIKEINRTCSRGKVKPSSVCVGYRGCLLSAIKEEREMAYEDMKSLLSVASEIGAPCLTIVPVFGAACITDLSPFKTSMDLEKELLIYYLEKLAVFAEKEHVHLVIECLNRYETHLLNRLEQAVDICKKINSKYINAMGDLFHMNIEETDIYSAIQQTGSLLKHLHLADSTRLQPGYGHIDFKKVFQALKKIQYKDYLSLECMIKGDADVALPNIVKYLKSSERE